MAARLVVSLVLSIGLAATAGAQHQDILYGVNDGHVKTGATDFDTFSLVPDVRVFGNGTFTFNSGQGGLWTDDPGHTSNDSPPGMNMLPDDAELHFNIVVEPSTGLNLSYWDGDTYPITWGPVPNGESVELSFASNLAVADGGSSQVTGFRIATEPASGGIHTHLDYHLRPTGSATGGIYLVALEATIVPALASEAAAPSPRFWLVFRYNESSTDHDAAIQWVEANLDVPDCQDGYDNDGDGRVDLLDVGCDDSLDESEYSLALICDDGIDNDGDGLVDLTEDAGCQTASDATEQFQCEDGLDNDNDGLIDYPADPQCTFEEDNREAPNSGGGSCGMGPELALLLPLVLAARRRRPSKA